MRQVVSYGDIVPDPRSSLTNDSPSPSKKPKIDGNATVAFELSRELTHAEIWNDSVLIDAWEAVHEEYAVRSFLIFVVPFSKSHAGLSRRRYCPEDESYQKITIVRISPTPIKSRQ